VYLLLFCDLSVCTAAAAVVLHCLCMLQFSALPGNCCSEHITWLLLHLHAMPCQDMISCVCCSSTVELAAWCKQVHLQVPGGATGVLLVSNVMALPRCLDKLLFC
jgi:hypothetical protein